MLVLVTGGAGFIGSHVCEQLLAKGVQVRAVDCFLDESYDAEVKRATWHTLTDSPGLEQVQHDLRTPLPDGLLDGVDVVLNEAAMPGLTRSWTDFDLYSSCNLGIVANLLQGCVQAGVPHLVQISTSSVYGENATGDESTPTLPISPYGVTKLAAEELVRAYARTFGVGFTILRYFSVYGPRQRPDMAYHRIIESVLDGREIDIYGDGHQSRTNTFVDDCAAATVRAVERRPQGETVNIAGHTEATLLEVVGLLEELIGRPASLRFLDAAPGDQRHTRGDTTKARALLDYSPRVSLRDGLAAQVEWQRSLVAG